MFPNSDLITFKKRPALVVQADDLQTGISQVIVALITSQMFRSGHPSRITILADSPEGERSGLYLDSVVMTDNLVTIQLPLIERLIGSLEITAVNRALKHTLGLS